MMVEHNTYHYYSGLGLEEATCRKGQGDGLEGLGVA